MWCCYPPVPPPLVPPPFASLPGGETERPSLVATLGGRHRRLSALALLESRIAAVPSPSFRQQSVALGLGVVSSVVPSLSGLGFASAAFSFVLSGRHFCRLPLSGLLLRRQSPQCGMRHHDLPSALPSVSLRPRLCLGCFTYIYISILSAPLGRGRKKKSHRQIEKKTSASLLHLSAEIITFAPSGANIPPESLIMGKIRNTASGILKGKVGNTTYYYRQGEQIARQALNNSNYGESARRSETQQERRVKWANLVNLYKVMSNWMPKAFETKKRNQTDYNMFMSLNVPSTTISLTKDEANKGCAVVDAYIIAQGSLPPVQSTGASGEENFFTDIYTLVTITNTTTVGELSADIIAKNAGFQEGDNIAFIIFSNWADGTSYPYAATEYYELTLDSSSTALFQSNPLSQILSKSTASYIGVGAEVYATTKNVGWACIHTRQTTGALKVSSQSIVLLKPVIVDNYSTTAQQQLAVNSYGVDSDVPLDPSFKNAVIESVAVNGSITPLINGRIVSYQQPVTLVITGENMTPESVYLDHDGVRYTPLVVDGNSLTFVLGDNGTNRIYVNGQLYGGVAISGIVVPEGLPTRLGMYQYGGSSGSINSMSVENTTCINYPYAYNADYSRFVWYAGSSTSPFIDTDDDNYEFVNITEHVISSPNDYSVQIVLTLEDTTQPGYILYRGFIVSVFNYSA